MLSMGISALLGFVFWSIAAHRYSPSDIGVVTALIGVASFIIGFSQLGYVSGLVRYMSEFRHKNNLINTVFSIVGVIAIFFSIFFIAISKYVFPKADFISQGAVPILFFILYVLSSAYGGILDGLFVAFRSTQFTFIRNISASTAKILAILVLGGGLIGLFYSITVATLFGSLIGLYFLWKEFKYVPSRNLSKEVRIMSRFSLVNYLSSSIATLVIALIPILIIWKIGASDAAFYYIAYSVVAVLNFIPNSISQSFFSESSNDEGSLKVNLNKSTKLISSLLIPSAIILIVFGKYILLIFGKEYSVAALTCLRLLTLTSVLSTINYLGDNILNIQKRLKTYTYVNIFCALSTIIFMYPLLRYGLTGVGLGWLLSEAATAIIYLYIFRSSIFTKRTFS